MIIRCLTLLTICASLLLAPKDSLAATHPDILLRHSAMCSEAFTQAERKYGIPKHLLMAVANTESGRYHKGIGRTVPWPWTTNVAGKGGYHDSLHDAMTTVRRAQQSGTTSIDIGCMQINLKHHPKAFKNLKDGFNPKLNVDYAASFLRRNYDEMRSWPRAIAAYHSRTPSRGKKYYALVRKRWREVRVNAGGQLLEDTEYLADFSDVKVTHLASSGEQNLPPFKRYSVPSPQAAAHSAFKVQVTDDTDGSVKRNFNTSKQTKTPTKHSMKIIKVAARPVDNKPVTVVVTPTSQRDALEMDEAFKDDKSYTGQKIIKVADRNISKNYRSPTRRKKQPNFIFVNQ